MHTIKYLIRSGELPKRKIAQDCHMGLLHPIRFYKDVLDDYEQAMEFIKGNDSRCFDNIATRYRQADKVFWLIKLEYIK